MPHDLIAAAAARTWAKTWTGAGTGLASVAFFWLGMLNVTFLVIVLSAASKRRNLRREAPRHAAAHGRRHRAADHPLRRATDERPAPAGAGATPEAATVDTLEPAVARMRLSDAERDEAADRVCRAIAEGRLSIAEGAGRVDRVIRATRRATLVPVLADLPSDEPPAPAPGPPAGALALRVAAAALIAGAAVLQGLAGIWALWPVAIAALAPLAFSPRHGLPPARDARVDRNWGPGG